LRPNWDPNLYIFLFFILFLLLLKLFDIPYSLKKHTLPLLSLVNETWHILLHNRLKSCFWVFNSQSNTAVTLSVKNLLLRFIIPNQEVQGIWTPWWWNHIT
jgi:hypothetical protein